MYAAAGPKNSSFHILLLVGDPTPNSQLVTKFIFSTFTFIPITTYSPPCQMKAKAIPMPGIRITLIEGWTYNESLHMVIHPADCSNCTSMCKHYLVGIMNNDQTLVMAHQARDHTLSQPWQTKVDSLKRRCEETLQKLTVMHQKLNEAQVKLAEAQWDHMHLMGTDNKPRHQQDGLKEECHISASGPSSFQLPQVPSYPQPTDLSQAMEHKIIYISSNSNDSVSLILLPPRQQPTKSSESHDSEQL